MPNLENTTPNGDIEQNNSVNLTIAVDESLMEQFADEGENVKGLWTYMEVVGKENKLCPCCKKEHEVQRFKIIEIAEYKGITIPYPTIYEYCSIANKYIETEEMMAKNAESMKEAYRKAKEVSE